MRSVRNYNDKYWVTSVGGVVIIVTFVVKFDISYAELPILAFLVLFSINSDNFRLLFINFYSF